MPDSKVPNPFPNSVIAKLEVSELKQSLFIQHHFLPHLFGSSPPKGSFFVLDNKEAKNQGLHPLSHKAKRIPLADI
ncbi:hypothetical protein [Pedobacter aquatilis]|uniref:hypothetical protein n=1 Tax=Pedobacter aquatilis TaxID=351343 RepID=UPI00292E8D11|nr:hypothetical protein [Pedobacter aquatilis]